MKATLEVINRMRTDGVIGKYAIGGAVGATFYLEPSATLDIDVFVSFQTPIQTGLIRFFLNTDCLKNGSNSGIDFLVMTNERVDAQSFGKQTADAKADCRPSFF